MYRRGRYTDNKHSIYTFCRERWSVHSGNMSRMKREVKRKVKRGGGGSNTKMRERGGISILDMQCNDIFIYIYIYIIYIYKMLPFLRATRTLYLHKGADSCCWPFFFKLSRLCYSLSTKVKGNTSYFFYLTKYF